MLHIHFINLYTWHVNSVIAFLIQLIKYIMNFSVPIVLVGNKTDLYVDRMITTEQGKRLADSWHAAFLETSAKQNEVTLLYFSKITFR